VLLAHVLGCRRIELYTRYDYEPTADQLAAYRELIQRAFKDEPVAYLVGRKEFYSLSFKVTTDVLVPRPETEILVAEAVAHLRSLDRAGIMWDVCTGSGCVAIATASQVDDATVLATDVSPQAVAVAAENAAAHGLDGRIRVRQADLLARPGDSADLGDKFDVITANPPYVADGDPVSETVKYEPQLALRGGADGLDVIRKLVIQAPQHLAAGGVLAMEFGAGQADGVRDLLVAEGFGEPRIIRDHQGIERAAVAMRPEYRNT